MQWFYAALTPYIHYLPIQKDLSDLVQKIEWARVHDAEVWEMTQRAQEFARQNLMYEDHYLYLFLVLQKLASFEEIDFTETDRDSHWKCIQYRKRLALEKSLRKISPFFHVL
jgi:hypothetical protein